MNVEKFKSYLEKEGNLLEKKASTIDERVAEESVNHFQDEILAYGKELRKRYFGEIEQKMDQLHQLATVADILNNTEGSVIDLEKLNHASQKAEKVIQGLATILEIPFFAPVEDWSEPVKKVLEICGLEYTQSGNYIIVKED